jgi:hypothetical protein
MNMKLNRIVLTASLLAPLVLVTPGASADEKHEHEHEHRQHGAHVHGIGALNLALEGQEMHIELNSPAANIVGFEHAPSSEADQAALDKAVAMLKDGDRLFRFNAEAGCRMEKTDVSSSLLDDGHHEHEEHADEHKVAHEHEKYAEHDHDEHEHEHEDETHSDIEAAYHFECDQPGKLTQLSVELFEIFPGTEKLNVQYVIESKQGAGKLTPADHAIKF